jgi:anti-sigma regulatory factor (Ser/Thr protein kinase)
MSAATATSLGPSAQRLIRVSGPADVGEARRHSADLADMLTLDPTAAGKLALGINEAGSNIVKHAGEGCMLLRALQCEGQGAVEVLALDRGSGMANITECMRDGFSTAGSPGTGLGALSRLSGDFRILSHPGKGTALRFTVGARPEACLRSSAVSMGAVCVPKAGETACGDGWALLRYGAVHTLLVVDGLGHGIEAAAAANAAIDIALRYGQGLSAADLIARVHAGLRATRGAAGAAVVLDFAQASGSVCGIGNISVAVRDAGRTRKLVSHNGILGHQGHKLQEFAFALPPGALLIAHSDGLDTRWRVEDYPGLENAHPALIAGVLYRDHNRGRDDATALVLRNETGSSR